MEQENYQTAGGGTNDTTGDTVAEVLGILAQNEKSGDENHRLGFEVHGRINADRPADVDVYSFEATAGTQVWIDLDRTGGALDSFVELLDVNGTIAGQLGRRHDAERLGPVADRERAVRRRLLHAEPQGRRIPRCPCRARPARRRSTSSAVRSRRLDRGRVSAASPAAAGG